MDDIFGISMNGVMLALLVLLALCSLAVVWVAVRRPVIFRMGMRNVPRRRAQAGVVVTGLMLSTLIIAAALGIGDTLDNSITGEVTESLGGIDELVVASQDAQARVDLATEGVFPAKVFDTLAAATADDDRIDGLLPMMDARAAVVNDTRQLAEPDIILTGFDPAYLDGVGGLVSMDGRIIDVAILPADGVVLSAGLATDLDATVGDQLTIFHENVPTTWTVAAIAEDGFLSGTRRGVESGLVTHGLAMPLVRLQEVTGQSGLISAIAVSNRGDAGVAANLTPEVVSALEANLAGQGLGIDPIRVDRVDAAERITTLFTSIFLILGLFSISAGVLLIVLIFTMLAAERRAEMGMARAIGAHRRQLIEQFVCEGSGYAILAGMVGAALGVVAALGIANGMKLIFGDYVSIEPMVTARSLVVAYCAGVVITFVTVVAASWKVSRINIVAAVRDIPDVVVHHRNRKALLWGVLMIAAGGFLTFAGSAGSTALLFMSGMSLLPFGLAQVLGFLGVPRRPMYSLIAIALLVFWLLPESAFSAVFGEFDGGIEMFFVSGIVLVVAVSLLVVNNLGMLLSGLAHVGRAVRPVLPAMRTAIAYPAAARGRTGMTIAMFSLIVFSLVMMATMNINYAAGVSGDEANAGWHVRADAVTTQPIADFQGALEGAGVDTGGIEAVGVVHSPTSAVAEMRLPAGDDATWKSYPVYGMESSFIDGSTLSFGQRAAGYDTDEAIVEALRTEPGVVVLDVFAVPEAGDIGGNEDAFLLRSLARDDATFHPITVELLDPASGSVHAVTVIGILDETIGSLSGMYGGQPTIDAIYNGTAATSWFIALDDSDEASEVARQVESALLQSGVSGISIRDELKAEQAQENGFLYIIEGFMGLGLLVGIAAVGVIAFRSVVERRQQIGVMRALGFQRRMVVLSFMIETSFVVGIGGLSGTVLGLLLARNLLTSDTSGISETKFLVPWALLLVMAVATNLAALLMTMVPALQAGRIAPAEALRYE